MSLNVRLLIIIAVGAIVAVSCFAVYSMLGGDNAAEHKELGSLDNYKAATELKAVPEIHFLDGAGKDRTLADFKGKVVVLNLWATWCTPCVAEMPTLEHLQQKMGENDVVVIALSIDRGGVDTVREFFDRVGVKALPVFVDPTMRAQSTLSAFGLPTTIIIDRDGNERGRLLGPAEWDSDRAIDLIETAMSPAK
jgi:thiol-disulfide isomerase/thioredoxin